MDPQKEFPLILIEAERSGHQVPLSILDVTLAPFNEVVA